MPPQKQRKQRGTEHWNSTPVESRPLLKFYLLILTLSLPFWLAANLTQYQLVPGVPVSGLMFVCPAIAALILVYQENKTAGVVELLLRAFDFRKTRVKTWYALVLLLMPAIAILEYSWLRWTGVRLPFPGVPATASLSLVLLLFIAATGEELGWSGYAIDSMQERWSALSASILLGTVWAGWHVVPLVQAHRTPSWIIWWCFGTVADRILIVWVYNNAGRSVFAASVFHGTGNLAWQLFPIHGSYFDPRLDAVIKTLVTFIVVLLWGPRTLMRHRETTP